MPLLLSTCTRIVKYMFFNVFQCTYSKFNIPHKHACNTITITGFFIFKIKERKDLIINVWYLFLLVNYRRLHTTNGLYNMYLCIYCDAQQTGVLYRSGLFEILSSLQNIKKIIKVKIVLFFVNATTVQFIWVWYHWKAYLIVS